MITSEIKDATKVPVNELLSGRIKCPLQHAQIVVQDYKGLEPLEKLAKIYGLNVKYKNYRYYSKVDIEVARNGGK